MKRKGWIYGVLVALFFLSLRLHNLFYEVNFGPDQGLQLLEIHRRYTEKDFTLIGPYSSFQVEGKSFFFGPLSYYLPIPWLVLFNWAPLSASYFIIFFQGLGLILSVWILNRAHAKWRTILLYVFFFSTFPPLVYYGRFFWNPNFHLAIASVLVACIYYWMKKRKDVFLFFIGILFGIGMQPHFAFILSILLSLSILIYNRIPLRKLVFIFGGFIVGFFPWIWFELRHSFYNTTTMIRYFLTSHGGSGSFQEYYLLCLMPFFILLFSFWLGGGRSGKKKTKGVVFVFLTLLYGLMLFGFRPKRGMENNWNYQGLSTAYSNIMEDYPEESYNVVDLLTGDTRAMSLRYLLTIAKKPPQPIDAYPRSSPIYVYTRVPIDEIRKGTLWELDGIRPFKVMRQWNIQDDVVLYKLGKDENME